MDVHLAANQQQHLPSSQQTHMTYIEQEYSCVDYCIYAELP